MSEVYDRIERIGEVYDQVAILKSSEVVEVNIYKNDGYTREETDELLLNKIDVPELEDWATFELILSN